MEEPEDSALDARLQQVLDENQNMEGAYKMLHQIRDGIRIRYWNNTSVECFETANRLCNEGYNVQDIVMTDEFKVDESNSDQIQGLIRTMIAQDIARTWRYHKIKEFFYLVLYSRRP